MNAESHILLGLLSLSAVLGAGGCAAVPARAPGPGEPDAQASWDAWHGQRLAALTAPDGWLTLVGLAFLEDGEHLAGQGGGDVPVALRYGGCASELIGAFEVRGDVVRFHPRAGAAVEIERGAPGQPLTADDAGAPSVVRSGSVSFTLVRRNDRLALRVRDAESPVRRAFRGIERFPFDPGAVCEARTIPPAPGEVVEIMNVTGFLERQPVAARLSFTWRGHPYTFVATAGSGRRLFVVFGDATNGRASYGGGRFLDVPAPVSGRTVIDFNRAVNPPCAFTPYATCPLPPAENRLAVEVRAGERGPGAEGGKP